jgi:hypothetical protein
LEAAATLVRNHVHCRFDFRVHTDLTPFLVSRK